MNSLSCQMESKDRMHVGRPQLVLLPFRTRLITTIFSPLSPTTKTRIKKYLIRLTTWRAKRNQTDHSQPEICLILPDRPLKAGDWVHVRSLIEIRATLNSKDRLKGCKFMQEMEQYCETTQRVYKPVERFLNERDYTIRKSNGLVLLENLFCQGFEGAGRCDRSCFYFWRVEWLELLDNQEVS